MAKRLRLSGEDIQFINQLRGKEEPVYEIVNGRPQYRPLLEESEIEQLGQFRKNRVKCFTEEVLYVSQNLTEPANLALQGFEIAIKYKHKKKGYELEIPIR